MKNYGKHAFSLVDRKRRRVLRACLRSDAIAADRAHVALLEKVRQGQAKAEELETFHQLREKRIEEILAAEPDALFTIEEIEAEVPPESRIVESAVCDRCREPTRVDLLRDVEGRRLCIPCAQKASEKGKEYFK